MRRRTGRLTLSVAGLATVAIALFLQSTNQPQVRTLRDRLESTAYDIRMRALLPSQVTPDPRIVVLDIDEKSLREQGHWPWSRWKIARLVNNLFAFEAAVVGFDVVFAEAEPNPALETADLLARGNHETTPEMIEQLEQIAKIAGPDAELAKALSAGAVVLGYSFTDKAEQSVGALPQPLDGMPSDMSDVELYTRDSFVANLQTLQDAALGGGFFSLDPDSDGIIRRIPLLARYGDSVYPALALEVVRVYLGMPPIEPGIEHIGDDEVIENLSLAGMIDIRTDDLCRILVPFRGHSGAFPYISATDVLEGRADPAVFRDAIVLVGTSAVGLVDLRAVPVQNVYPGVEVHANVIAGILDGNIPYAPPWIRGVDFTVMAVVGLTLALLFPWFSAVSLVTATSVAVFGYAGAYIWIWQRYGLDISVAVPVLMIFMLSAVNMTYGFLTERRNRENLKDMFGQYVPPAVVDEIIDSPHGEHGFEGETRELTVLFSDIRDFTSISEKLSAAELKQMLNFYFTEMTGILFDHRGTIDKYVGDMVMAFWGAPLADKQHRRHGVSAALAMLERLEQLQPELQARGWPRLRIGIGLNTGVMNVGDMGSVFRRSYTVIGDAVNLGSRLEGLSKYYGVGIVVSETVMAEDTEYLYRKLDLVKVKGKEKAVAIYEPLCLAADADDELKAELDAHHQALDAYYRRQWQVAGNRFEALVSRFPERKLYTLYRERVEHLRDRQLPPDWDGVFTHTTK